MVDTNKLRQLASEIDRLWGEVGRSEDIDYGDLCGLIDKVEHLEATQQRMLADKQRGKTYEH